MNRRRFVHLLAATGLIGLGAGLGGSASLATMRSKSSYQPVYWQGRVIGADASLILETPDRAQGEQALFALQRRLDELEQAFSLYIPTSHIARLNQTRQLQLNPGRSRKDRDFLALLNEARLLFDLTEGYFDPTIQPLWQAFASQQLDINPVIGFDKVRFNEQGVQLEPGMALSLNGIAQGYITDQITSLLRAYGFDHMLVNMGEYRGIGRAWEISTGPGRPAITLDKGTAVATSSPHALRFVNTPQQGHIFNPFRKIDQNQDYQKETVSVIADHASLADGLSTACCILPEKQRRSIAAQHKSILRII